MVPSSFPCFVTPVCSALPSTGSGSFQSFVPQLLRYYGFIRNPRIFRGGSGSPSPPLTALKRLILSCRACRFNACRLGFVQRAPVNPRLNAESMGLPRLLATPFEDMPLARDPGGPLTASLIGDSGTAFRSFDSVGFHNNS